jgi:cbb3-type cytochrome oxidase maturation protein
MGYYLPWLLLVMVSLSAALGGFLWALRNGQFSDQQRARYLPLRDMLPLRGPVQGNPVYPKIIFVSLLAVTALMMAAAVYIIFSHARAG